MKNFKRLLSSIILSVLLVFTSIPFTFADNPVTIISSDVYDGPKLIQERFDGPKVSDSEISNIVKSTFNLNSSSSPYSEARVKAVYNKDQSVYKLKALVVYLMDKDTYSFKAARINLNDNRRVSLIEQNYSDQAFALDAARPEKPYEYATRADDEIEAVFATCEEGIPTAVDGVKKAAETAQQAGYKVKVLIGSEATTTAYKYWMQKPNLKIFGNIGHGLTTGIMLKDGTLSYSWFNSLPGTTLNKKVLYFNSCQVHNSPLEPAIVKAGAQKFIGGNVDLSIGPSEKVFKYFWNLTLINKQPCTASLTKAELDTKYQKAGDHGISGNGSEYVTEPGVNPQPTATPVPTSTPTPSPTSQPGNNLALNKAVSVSATYDSYNGSNAVDGDQNTRWTSYSSSNQWLAIDLAANANINKLRIKWSDTNYPKQYTLQSWNGSTWINQFNVTGNGGWDEITLSRAFTTNKVRINCATPNSSYYTIYEVEAYGTSNPNPTATPVPTATPTPVPTATPTPQPTQQPGSNLALNKNALVSSAYQIYEGHRAVDGDANTFWAASANTTQWISVDLGTTASINKIKVKWSSTNYARQYQIQSWNGSSWITQQTVNGDGNLDEVTLSRAFSTNKIRINCTAPYSSYFTIYELEVYGGTNPNPTPTPVPTATPTPVPTATPIPTATPQPSGTNLALNKYYAETAHATIDGVQYLGKNAFDGNYNTRWTVAANGTTSHCLYVDFKNNVNVASMKLQWSDGNNYAKTYTIWSWNGSSWVLQATRSGKTGLDSFNFNSPFTTRYLSINCGAQSAGQYFTLYEAEVYGSTNPSITPTPVPTVKPTPTPTPTPIPTSTPTPTPVTGGNKYILTCVNDDLDNQDMYLMATELNQLGYKQELINANVSSANLKSYLNRNDITTLYHTGHGLQGAVMTANNGSLYVNTATLNVQNTIIATCLTLSDTSIKNAFGSNAKTLLGYTKVSFDMTDNDVVTKMGSSLSSGNSYMRAWYLANAPIASLSDRWCGYVKEGNSIVEYSARTGNIPKARENTTFVSLDQGAKVNVASSLLQNDRNTTNRFEQLRNDTITATLDGSNKAEFYRNADSFLDKSTLTKEKALEIAEKWLKDKQLLPEDAVLDKISPIDYKDNGNSEARTIAYILRYSKQINGLTIRSNAAEDNITVLVNGTSVVSYSKQWHEVTTTRTAAQNKTIDSLMTISQAIKKASTSIAASLKGSSIQIIDAKPCYSIVNGKIIPAYEYICSDGYSLILDAATGQLVK